VAGGNTISGLLPALEQIARSLHDRRAATVRISVVGPDRIMAWDWVRSILARRLPDLETARAVPQEAPAGASRAEADRDTLSYRLARGGPISQEAGRDGCCVELPEPNARDLIAVLDHRRRDMILHHGLFISRETVRRALGHSLVRSVPKQSLLSRTLDLLDAAVLAYRQSLLGLARTHGETILIGCAFSTIALAIERAGQAGGAGGVVRSDQRGRPTPLLDSVRQFQSLIEALGGPRRAGVVRPEFIDHVAGFAG
jgi:hypothetical protein